MVEEREENSRKKVLLEVDEAVCVRAIDEFKGVSVGVRRIILKGCRMAVLQGHKEDYP